MKASPEDQRALLKLQQIDREIAAVNHKRTEADPARVVAALTERGRTLTRERITTEAATSDLRRESARIEADLDQVKRRQQVQRDRLDRSEGSPKELAGIEGELEVIAKRIDALEDQQLELLEQIETHEERTRALEAAIEDVRTQIADTRAGAAATTSGFDSELAHLRANRSQITGGLNADLVDLYESISADTGGIGAVAVYGRRVEGMPITLGPAEADALRAAAPDDVLQSWEYDVILVRLPEDA